MTDHRKEPAISQGKLSASIVLFRTPKETVKRIVECFLSSPLLEKLYIINNSPDTDYTWIREEQRIHYLVPGTNKGYGSAHNLALREALKSSQYHVVSNPDIFFRRGTLERIYEYMEKNQRVGQLMPRIVSPLGEVQHLCKLLPSPSDLFIRRFIPLRKLRDALNAHYELHSFSYATPLKVPYLSGCFMWFRVSALGRVGLFDERFFMYPEDIDITRRMYRHECPLYVPTATVVHDHGKESYKNIRMTVVHLRNMVKYFNKWGWFFDQERSRINKEVRNSIIALSHKGGRSR